MTINCLKETSTERRIVLNWPALIHCGSLLGTIHCPFSWESPFFWFSRSIQVIYVNHHLSEEAFDILRCESSSSSGSLTIFFAKKSLKNTRGSYLMIFCWREESYQVYKLPTSILSTSELWYDKHPDVPWGSLGWGRETQSKSPNCCDQRLCKIFIRSVNF